MPKRDLNKILTILEVKDAEEFEDYDNVHGYGHALYLDLDDTHIIVKKEDVKLVQKLIDDMNERDYD